MGKYTRTFNTDQLKMRRKFSATAKVKKINNVPAIRWGGIITIGGVEFEVMRSVRDIAIFFTRFPRPERVRRGEI